MPRHLRRAPYRLFPVFAAALAIAACGSEPHGSPAPRALADPAAHVAHIGLDEDAPAEATIGRVVAARLTDGGRHVVVLDFVAPFVKVFDGRGRFVSAFLRKGGGPGESRGPTALAAAGDSLVLVANAAEGVSVYTLAGEARARARIRGLVPLAATSWCGGEWLVYGPRVAPSGDVSRATWLHRLRPVTADSFEVTSVLADTVPERMANGLAYGLVSEGRTAVVRHALRGGGAPRVFRVSCDGGEPRLLHEGEPAPVEGPRERGDGKVTSTIRPGIKYPGGMAAVGGRVVVGEKVYVGEGHQRLDLTLVDGRGAASAGSIAGNFSLQDSRPDTGVLVSTSEPVPQVFLVRSPDFLEILDTP